MKPTNVDVSYISADELTAYQFIGRCLNVSNIDQDLSNKVNSIQFAIKVANSDKKTLFEHPHLILKIDEKTLSNIRTALNANPDSGDSESIILRNKIHISNMHGHGYMSGSFKAFIDLQNDRLLMDNEYIASIFTVLSDEYPELFERQHTRIIPSIRLMKRKEFIKDVEINYNADRIKTILGKHLTHTMRFKCEKDIISELARKNDIKYDTGEINIDELSIINPLNEKPDKKFEGYDTWTQTCEIIEQNYKKLIEVGAATVAKSILPAFACTIGIMTATENEWLNAYAENSQNKAWLESPTRKEILHQMKITMKNKFITK